MRSLDRCQFSGVGLCEILQRFQLSRRVFVQNQRNVFPIWPLLHFTTKNLAQVSAGDISHVVFFVHHDSHVVRKTGSEKGQQEQQNGSSPRNSHDHILSERVWGGKPL